MPKDNTVGKIISVVVVAILVATLMGPAISGFVDMDVTEIETEVTITDENVQTQLTDTNQAESLGEYEFDDGLENVDLVATSPEPETAQLDLFWFPDGNQESADTVELNTGETSELELHPYGGIPTEKLEVEVTVDNVDHTDPDNWSVDLTYTVTYTEYFEEGSTIAGLLEIIPIIILITIITLIAKYLDLG